MMDKIERLRSVEALHQLEKSRAPQPQTAPTGEDSFAAILRNERVKFSQHAQERMVQRKMNLSPQDVDRIADAVDRAAVKGSRESLLLMENMALVVSVKNRTVITAVDSEKLKDNVFTNIDSAVVVSKAGPLKTEEA